MGRRMRVHGVVKPMSSIPRCFRPRLTADQRRDLSIAHHTNLDLISKGQADAEVLWQWAAGVVTWSEVAKRLKQGEPEIRVQLDLVDAVVDRFRRTGRVGFSGVEYQLAKDGVIVMDLLAEATDAWTAGEAAEWSAHQVQRMEREAAKPEIQFVFCSGSADFLTDNSDRRFWPVRVQGGA